MPDYKDVVTLLEEQAQETTTATHTKFVLNQGPVEGYYKANGIEKKDLKIFNEVQGALNTGAYEFGATKLIDIIKQKKKEGGDMKDPNCKVEVVMRTALGPDKLTIRAAKDNRSPQDGSSVVSYGGFRLNCVRKRTFNDDAVSAMQEKIKKAVLA